MLDVMQTTNVQISPAATARPDGADAILIIVLPVPASRTAMRRQTAVLEQNYLERNVRSMCVAESLDIAARHTTFVLKI
jgi:hypothetical protein